MKSRPKKNASLPGQVCRSQLLHTGRNADECHSQYAVHTVGAPARPNTNERPRSIARHAGPNCESIIIYEN